MAPFITLFLTAVFFGAMWNVILITNNFANYIRLPVIVIMVPFCMGYLISLFEYIRGNV
jgi:hypothetical protein